MPPPRVLTAWGGPFLPSEAPTRWDPGRSRLSVPPKGLRVPGSSRPHGSEPGWAPTCAPGMASGAISSFLMD